MKPGDKAFFRGYGKMRAGTVVKLTDRCVWVHYTSGNGTEHTVRKHRGAVFPTMLAFQAAENARAEEYAQWMAARTRRPPAAAAVAIAARKKGTPT